MLPTKAEFFEQATRRLCGTLDFRTGLERLYAYIREIMPLRSIDVGSSPQQALDAHGMLSFRVSDAGSTGDRNVFRPSQTRWLSRHSLMDPGRFHGELITSADHPLITLYRELAPEASSSLAPPWYVLRLTDERNFVGGCRFAGDPERPFTPTQCELLRSLEPVLCIALHNHLQYQRVVDSRENVLQENKRLRRALAGGTDEEEIVGAQRGLRRVLERVRLVAARDISVLINGETGTGKELVARQIHALSSRADGPFIALNCGAIPSSLIDSELFGHVRGAFTGATRDHQGYFERAHGGTLFLDEVGELPPDAQVRLLRALQERVVTPVGGQTPVPVDVRVVAATNRDLQGMMRTGAFREDLYYRLRVVHILLPPLRERPEDIPALVRHSLNRLADACGERPASLAPGEMERMMRYPWPGNVRELQNVLAEAVFGTPPGEPLTVALDEIRTAPAEAAADAGQRRDHSFPAVPPDAVSALNLTADEAQARHYRAVLEACGGRVKGRGGAAEVLGLAPSTLRFRLRRLNIPFGRKNR